MVSVDLKGFEELTGKLTAIKLKYPEEVNNMMKDSSKGFSKAVESHEKTDWTRRIGHDKYTEAEGWKPFRRSRYVKYSDKVIKGVKTWAIINNRRYYERFVNDGHAIRRKKRGAIIGYAPPSHHIEEGYKDYEPQFFANVESMLSRLFND